MLTLSAIKADIGSIGGHTQPSSRMMQAANDALEQAAGEGVHRYHIAHQRVDHAVDVLRITSYNVCYTKLLRILRQPWGPVGHPEGGGNQPDAMR